VFEIEYYKKPDGSEPMREHLKSLNSKLRVKVLRNLLILETVGDRLRYPETDNLGDGIFELRTIFGKDIERAFFFFLDGRKIIVTHGYIKKSQKASLREINRAKDYRQDYYRQRKQEGSNNDNPEGTYR